MGRRQNRQERHWHRNYEKKDTYKKTHHPAAGRSDPRGSPADGHPRRQSRRHRLRGILYQAF